MPYSIDIGLQGAGPVDPTVPPSLAAATVPRSSGLSTSEQEIADRIGNVLDGTHDGVSTSYNSVSREVSITNTDKGSVAVAAHEAALDPHPQYTTDAEAIAIADAAVAAHGAALDPHPQYVTSAEGDAAYAPLVHTHVAADVTDFDEAVDDRVAALLVAGTNVTLTYDDVANTLTVDATGGGGVTDHGALTGLADDDHTQYHNDARGDARYSLLAHTHSNFTSGTAGFAPASGGGTTNFLRADGTWAAPPGGGGSIDHGTLLGLADNDHPQYALLTGATFTGNVTTPRYIVNALGAAGTPAFGYTTNGLFFPTTSSMAFTQGGTERGRIVSGGNWLIRTTTSAIYDTATGGDSSAGYPLKLSGGLGITTAGHAWYNNSLGANWITWANLSNGRDVRGTAVSGAFGNLTVGAETASLQLGTVTSGTFAYYMRLENNAVSIGTTSAASAGVTLDVGVTVPSGSSGSGIMRLFNKADTNHTLQFRLTDTAWSGAGFTGKAAWIHNTNPYPLIIGGDSNADVRINTASVERVRINNAGNVLVNSTSSPLAFANRGIVDVNGVTAAYGLQTDSTQAGYLYHDGTIQYLYNVKNGSMIFGTNGTARVTIGAAGETTFSGAVITDDVQRTTAGDLTVNSANASGQIAFRIAGAEAGRFNVARDFLVGTTTSPHSTSNRGVIQVNGASSSLVGLSIAGTGKAYAFHDGGTFRFGSASGGGGTTLIQNGSDCVQVSTSGIFPVTDNTFANGNASQRWSIVYSAGGVLTSSDGTLKRDIEEISDAEVLVARGLKKLIRKYRFHDAYAKKGEVARIHFGVIAQDVRTCFAEHGLDAHRYGIFCEDTFDEPREIPRENPEDPMSPELFGPWPEPVRVTRLGIRYDQLLAFIIAGL